MPYLNWRNLGEQELQKSVTTSPGAHSRSPEVQLLTLTLDGVRLTAFREFFDEVFTSRSEGRIELSQEWRIFLKWREGESRILMAHPEESQWVMTVMLTQSDAEAVKTLLCSSGIHEIQLSQSVRLNAATSNGDWLVRKSSQETVLVVEDTAAMRELLLQLVSGLPGNIRPVGVTNGAQLRSEVRKNRPSWVLLDEVLPGESSLELAVFLSQEGIPYALVSATGDREAPLPLGCQVRLQKPDWDSLEEVAAHWAKWWENARNAKK